jgi:tRNA(adenine34) deaminase
MSAKDDLVFMQRALDLAAFSQKLGEVPVGCIVVRDNKIIGEGYNRREMMRSCVEHAELMALAAACAHIGNWRLLNAVVYTTLEPCIMCTGALLHARISRLVFGAHDLKFGAIESLYKLSDDPRLNHRFAHSAGVLAQQSAAMLKNFFKQRRAA